MQYLEDLSENKAALDVCPCSQQIPCVDSLRYQALNYGGWISLSPQITTDPLLTDDLHERLPINACGASIVSIAPGNIVR